MEYMPHQQPLPILEKDGNNTKLYDEEENECNIDDMMNNKENNNDNVNTKHHKSLAETFKSRGNELLKQKNFRDAKREYTKAIELDPKNAIYFSNRAAACTKLNEFEQALDDSYVDLYYIHV